MIAAAFAGLLALCAATGPFPAAAATTVELMAPMTIVVVRSDAADCGTNCPEWLALTGRIVPQTPSLLHAVLDRLGPRRVPVLVDSGGGAVEAAITMGRMIRERHLDVAVADTGLIECAREDRACLARSRAGERTGFVAGGVATCASACVLILAAGTDRSVGGSSYVGVHQIVARRSVDRMMNRFRVVRRFVDGRVVEVSRTLVATVPLSSYTETVASPERMYTEVDRYLLGLGIAESIMPLMRATPPTAIHWMLPTELALTRIANDTTDARTLVARSVLQRDATVAEPVPVSLTLADDVLQDGTVTWRTDRRAASVPDPARLAAEIDVLGRHLHGSLSITRNTDPGQAASFIVAVRLADADTVALTTMGSPKICDATNCPTTNSLGGRLVKGAASDYVFWIGPREGDRLLSALRDRTWLAFPVRFDGGASGEFGLTLSGAARQAILDWQQWCCGLSRPVASARRS